MKRAIIAALGFATGVATSLADDVVVVITGQIVWKGSAESLRANDEVQHTWLGI